MIPGFCHSETNKNINFSGKLASIESSMAPF